MGGLFVVVAAGVFMFLTVLSFWVIYMLWNTCAINGTGAVMGRRPFTGTLSSMALNYTWMKGAGASFMSWAANFM